MFHGDHVRIKDEESHHRCGLMCQLVVYYQSIKRELKTRPIYECRCDGRLKTKAEVLQPGRKKTEKMGDENITEHTVRRDFFLSFWDQAKDKHNGSNSYLLSW
jgi:hypothetical protein